MSVKSCEKLENSEVALTVEVSAEDFEAALNKAYLKMREQDQHARLPPRQGSPQDDREHVRRRGVL